jgi:uncharacterized protein YbaP (TraB family)
MHRTGLLGDIALRARGAAALVLLGVLAGGIAPAPAAERYERGLLWRIEGKSAPASHVFGTIHLADPRVTALPTAVMNELNRARSLTIEVRLEPGTILALAKRMIYDDGRDLHGVAGPELFAKAAAITAVLGLPDPLLRMFKPWAVALLLSAPQQDPTGVLDIVLARAAAEQGKPVHQLESLEEQIAVFEGMSEAAQLALLGHAVENYERMPPLIARLVEAYLARDLAGMWRISEESGGDGAEARRLRAEFGRRLLDERNKRMAERSEARLNEGGAFIAVGALHLYGGAGMLALLEKRGYRVTRVY